MNNQTETKNSNALLKDALRELKRMRSELAAVERARSEPIAIVGMGCRFPGGANSPDAYWQLLKNGVDAVTEVPKDRWDIEEFYDPNPDTPGKMYVRQGAFLDRVDEFDPQFFGIAPREAVGMDPQQRLLLEVSWEALEHAGIAPDRLTGSQTGVFMGMFRDDYFQLGPGASDLTRIDAYNSLGGGRSIAVGRLSYVLGLHGPTLQLDTACSSSLVAIHLACQSLRARECDAALAGGVMLMITPSTTVSTCAIKALSPDGRCKTFDASADGYGRGEGCGVVVLKRLSDAIADGDNVLALIRGSGVNHDGRSNGLTAPNGQAQIALLRQVIESAKVRPEEIQYVEVHGTGTSLGDPIEVSALGSVLGSGRSPAENPLMLGSVKTNFGHLEAAAGVAALIKVVLAMQHRAIPPHLHLQNPNPYIAWDKLPITVPTELTPWVIADGKTRLAGVSAFGMSGTNAHVLLEEAPVPTKTTEVHSSPERPWHLLALSAKTQGALGELASRYEQYLAEHPDSALADVCFTANTGRSHWEYRLALWAETRQQMRQHLQQAAAGETPAQGVRGQVLNRQPPKVAFLFTGQGAQFAGMGRQLYETQPTFRATLEQCDRILRPDLEIPLLEVLYGQREDVQGLLDRTDYTQPALFALEYALAQLWLSWGVEPEALLGHSVGEYVAACIAGVFSLEDALQLIAERGGLMQQLPASGEMAAVFAPAEQVCPVMAPYAGQVTAAAYNSPTNTVISGERDAVQAVLAQLAANGVEFRTLKVSHAFHSPLMEPILDKFAQVARQVNYNLPQRTVVSNLTGTAIGEELTHPDYWVRHLRESVRFTDGMASLKQLGCEIFLEVGPKPTLLGLGQACLSGEEEWGTWLPSLRSSQPDWPVMLASLGTLYAQGVAIDWQGCDRDYQRQRLFLPTYPFQRRSYWLAGVEGGRIVQSEAPQAATPALHPLLHRQLTLAAASDIRFESHLSATTPAFLADHRVFETTIFPGAGYLELVLAAGKTVYPANNLVLEDVAIEQALVLPEKAHKTVQLVLTPQAENGYSFQLFSLVQSDGVENQWTRHVSGSLRPSTPGTALPPLAVDTLVSPELEEVELPAHYQQFLAQGLAYGENFRGLKRLWRRDGEVVAQIQLPDAIAADSDRFWLHPVLLDACFQGLRAALPPSSNEKTYLPVGLERLHLYCRPGRQLWCRAQLRSLQNGHRPLTGDLSLYNEVGQVVAELKGLRVQKATAQALREQTRQSLDHWLYEITWQAQPLTQQRFSSAPRRWLVFAGSDPVSQELVARLAARGDRCTVVQGGGNYQQHGDRIWIDPTNPADFQSLLAQTPTSDYQGILHLWSLPQEPAEDLGTDALSAAQRLSCGSILHLVQALVQSSDGQLPPLWLITQGAQLVGNQTAVSAFPAQQASVWGLGRTIAVEYPDLHCKCIDLDPSATEIEAFLDELVADAGEDQIAYRQQQRYVARLARYQPHSPASELSIQADCSYLITGGLGALGLQVARWLVERGAKHLVLVGRRGASETAQQAIAQLEAAGATVQVMQADVANPDAVAKMLAAVEAGLPPLRGIIHAAGKLADGTLLQQTWESFEGAIAPKVAGAWNLHVLTQHLSLDFFVLFSSVASLLGSAGQGNYAAANAFMDALAAYRRATGQVGLSINWGPWAEAGMAENLDQRNQERLSHLGIDAIAPAQGLLLLAQLLAQPTAQVGVLPVHWSQFLSQYTGGRPPQLLAAFVQSAQTNSPDRPPMLVQLEAAPVRERRSLLLAHMRSLVGEVLGIDLSQPADLERGFFELGMDSLMSVELRNRLRASLGCTLPPTVAFKYPTIAALTDYLAEEVLALDGSEATDEEVQTDPPAPDSSAEPLDDLSPDEVAALLAAELNLS